MTPHDIYIEAATLGLRLEVRGDKLAVTGRCPADFEDKLRQHKPALLEWLNSRPCPGCGSMPPSDLALDETMPEPDPRHRELVINFAFRQAPRPGPMAAWLVMREGLYYATCGNQWDCSLHAYCAARDLACWQLGVDETELWLTLEGFEESAR